MNRLDYLESLVEDKPEEIFATWKSLGSINVNNDTKVYIKDTIFRVVLPEPVEGGGLPDTSKQPVNGAIIYCISNYIVDNQNFPSIDWSSADVTFIESKISVRGGTMLPHFKVLLTKEQIDTLDEGVIPSDFIPFQNAQIKSSIISIDDEELMIIMAEAGCPFIRIDELEYTRDVLLSVCLKPAIQQYYKFFPIIEERDLGVIGGNQEFWFELPEWAFNAIVFYTVGTGGGAGMTLSPFAYFTSEIMGGGIPSAGGGSFGRGLTYRKPVPGFVGTMGGGYDAMFQQLQVQQGMLNFWRREKVSRIKKDGKMFINGFTTVGGFRCAKILKWSPDWDMVDFAHLPEVRQMCQSYMLRNLAQIRGQVKSDIKGAIDWQAWTSRGDALYERVIKFWNTTTQVLRLTPQRGGL